MTLQEKIEFLEDIMDVEEGSLTESTILEEVEEWDSLSTLTLTVKMKQGYDINLTTETIKEFVTVRDICNYIPD
jgi:Acyl carrier protein